jgi:hypothetical protein
VVAVSNSRKMLLSDTPLQGTDWQAALAEVSLCWQLTTTVISSHHYMYYYFIS